MKRSLALALFGALLGTQMTSFASKNRSGPSLRSSTGDGQPNVHPEPATRIREALGNLSLRFEANLGQTDSRVKFLTRGAGYTLFLTPEEAVLSLAPSPRRRVPAREAGRLSPRRPSAASPEVLRMKFLGADSSPMMTGLDELPVKTNYFAGNPLSAGRGWQTNIPNYRRVKYQAIYPGIDLVFYGDPGALEYDFIVEPGADPEAIGLGIEGATRLKIDHSSGDLLIQTGIGEIRQPKPHAFQLAGIIKQPVDVGYALLEHRRVSFRVADYDAGKPLVIDPVMNYSTYLGGSGADTGTGIALDSAGNLYVTGRTSSANFPPKSARQSSLSGSSDAFVSKLDAGSLNLVYSTYLGGSGDDEGRGIAVDSAGNAYVAGRTTSSNFPTKNPFQTSLRGTTDAFVAKLNATGSDLRYASYLGGGSVDEANAIAVDSSGNSYLTGLTQSGDFPTMGPFQSGPGGFGDAFMAKVNAEGSALSYSSYLGGGAIDQGNAIAVDSSGNAYVTGRTSSNNFPVTPTAFKSTNGGLADAFVAKLDPAASGAASLDYSTYLGGNGADEGRGIDVDASGSGNVYVTGDTSSTNFPTVTPFQAARAGGSGFDAFVAKVDPMATGPATLIYSSYLGGTGFDDHGTGIAVDSLGNVLVTGYTNSTNFPTMRPIQSANAGFSDGFVTKVSRDGSLILSTYLGGSGIDEASGIAADTSGSTYYVTGRTSSTNFPMVGAPFQRTNGGAFDAFVARIIETADLSIIKSASPDAVVSGQNLTYTIVVSNTGPDAAGAVILTDVLPSGTGFVSCEASEGRCLGPAAGSEGSVTSRFESIGPGRSSAITLVVKVLGVVGPALTNTASVSSATPDPSVVNNSTSITTAVTPRLLVGSFSTDSVLSFNARTGAFAGVFVSSGSGGLKGPLGLTFGLDGNLYVVSGSTNSVKRYNGATGAYMDDFVVSASGGLNGPSGLGFGLDSNLYVTSRNSVRRYSGGTGAFIDVFVPSGSGGLIEAQALLLGADSNLYVSNSLSLLFFDSVLRYNGRTGAFIDAFIPAGSGGLFGTQGLAFGPDGNLYVASRFNNAVLRYNGTTGAFIGVFAAGGGLSAPVGLAFGPDGNLYVSSAGTNAVKRYNGMTGAFINDFVDAGSGGLAAPAYLIFR